MEPHVQPEVKEVYYNRAQRISMAMRAHIEVWIAARAAGKTRGIIAPRVAHNAKALVRSLGGYVVPSIKKFKQQLGQSLMRGLKDLEFQPDRDYVIGYEPPKKWPRPYNEVLDYEYSLSFSWGSSMSFISQERTAGGVGSSYDYTINDESRLTDEERFDQDYMPAVRGNLQHFEGKPEHFSLLLCTDRPMTKKGRWVYRYRHLVNDQVNNWILQLQHKDNELWAAMTSGALTASTMTKYTYERNRIARQLNELRSDAVYYGEASVLDNIHNLGMKWLLEKEATVPEHVFKVAYMNEEVDFVEGAFYHGLDEDRHCYIPSVNASLSHKPISLEYVQDSSDDNEILSHMPLDIGMDYGSHINCLVVGQMFEDLMRVDNAMHVLHPELTVDVLHKFVRYYGPHKNKRVNYYIDHTARHTGGQSPFSYEQIVVNTLRSAGWDVNVVYIGKQPAPDLRYHMWGKLFRRPSPPVMFNVENCEHLLTSMRLCQVREGKNSKIEKNKSGEGKGDIEDEVLLPHYTDALDTLVHGRLYIHDSTIGSPVPSIVL